jgi:hypothetical protein
MMEWCSKEKKEKIELEVQIENRSEVDKWKKIYQILFPSETIPSPCNLSQNSASLSILTVYRCGNVFTPGNSKDYRYH